MEKYINKIINADCLEFMQKIPDKSIDCIICDLPYGTTGCKWDSIIPFDKLWKEYKRIRKDNTPIVLFGSEPFSTYLRMSNINEFKYDWVWNKFKAGNIFLADYQPMKIHEIISVFGKGNITYNPIKESRDKIKISKNYGTGATMGGNYEKENKVYIYEDKNPVSIIEISNASQKDKFHPTQKPIKLLEYLVQTYSNPKDIVLDNCSGSGTTAVACHNLNRRFICIEKDVDYYKASCERLANAKAQLKLAI